MSENSEVNKKQSEYTLENLLIKDLEEKHYERIYIKGIAELELNFRKQLNKFNEDKLENKPITDKEFERILLDINDKSVHQSAKILRDKILLIRDDNSTIYLELIDLKDYSKNIYQVTNQITVEGKYTNRYDVTLLINGLPILQIELKRRGMDIKQAFNQIERYRKHSYDGLFRYVQIFIISNGVDTKYFANTDTKPIFGFTFFWTDKANRRITQLKEFSDLFLIREHITKMLNKYMVINDADKMIMVMRPYQVYAVEALTKSAVETGSGGFIWHTTGSGKTLTSFKCSQILAKERSIKKVIFVVDRNDLDTQTNKEFNKFEDGSVDTTDSTNILVNQLKDEDKNFIVTTIQKLTKAIANPKYKKVFDTLEQQKIVIIFDECHRSTFGDWLKQIKGAFLKAQIFGFTGTPRFVENKSADNRTTADIFGKCLHTYLIKEAITDNNVLGFNVEYIKTFDAKNLNIEDKTKVQDIDKQEVYDSDEHISLVANHIVATHNSKTRNRQYCGILATSKVDNLIKYYDTFKSINHNLKITAIFSYGSNEDFETKDEHSRDSLERIITDYNDMFGTKYRTDTFTAYNNDLSKKVKTGQIDILIVVNMYLTGFDSKPLNTLYVDKNMEYHGLLQAYSRTNRVEQSTKPFGNVVCYRNLKKNTDEAIRLFSKTDTVDDVLLKSYDHYLDLFNKKVSELLLITPVAEDVDKLENEEQKKDFIIAFREVKRVLEVLNTFTDFEIGESTPSITLEEFESFQSKYWLTYERVNKDKDKVSILNDIDFSIELMATDRINVTYIMNLIRNIDLSDKDKQKKDVDNVKKELTRSDSVELRRKIDLIEKFLDEVVPKANESDNIDDLYDKFEVDEKSIQIKEFAEETEIDVEFLQTEVTAYEFTSIIDRENISKNINKPLLQKKKLSQKIAEFIEEIVLKFK